MSKSPIQFAGILFLLAAILAVSGQETIATSFNASLNNTTLLNNTTQNVTTSEPAIAAANESAIEAPALPAAIANETIVAPTEVATSQNETETASALAQEAAPSENATAAIEAIPAIPVVQPGGMMIGSEQRAAFAISGIGRTPNQFSIDGKALSQGAYAVGLPAKTIMDLSALPFFINKF